MRNKTKEKPAESDRLNEKGKKLSSMTNKLIGKELQVSAKSVLTPKTDEELRQLAMDIAENKVFTDRHLQQHEYNLINMIFMPLGLMDKETLMKFLTPPPGMIYEYYSEALPRGINGLPMFSSVKSLSREESDKIHPMIVEIMEFKQKFTKKEEKSNETPRNTKS